MRCTGHRVDGCGDCRPAMRAAWTVGQLKAALAGIPDDTPLVVNAAGLSDPELPGEQVIVSAGFGVVNWGDGYGPEQDLLFGLNCESPEGLLRAKPSRPRRRAGGR